MRSMRAAVAVACVLICWVAPAGNAIAGGNSGGTTTITEPSKGTFEGHTRVAGKTKHKKTSGKARQPKTLKKIVLDKPTDDQRAVAIGVMCREAREAGISCEYTPPKKNGREPAHLVLDLDAIARTLLTRIQLPDPTPQIGPDPKVNEWKMAAVGYPLWLWTAGPHTVTDRVHAYGVTFTLRATWVSSRFDMGDGHRVTCTSSRPFTKDVKPGTASPTCGYIYQEASLPKGNYTVTATTNWRITWSALGMRGSMPGSFTGTRQLPVGELDALVVG